MSAKYLSKRGKTSMTNTEYTIHSNKTQYNKIQLYKITSTTRLNQIVKILHKQ